MTLTAVPASGYVFSRWSGHTEGMGDPSLNPVTFRVGDRADNTRVITANFAKTDTRCRVAASSEPAGGGSVQLQPEQPSGGYPVNQSVSVLAVAQSGYVFSHWTGDLDGKENPQTLLTDKDRSFAAIFNPTVITHCKPTGGGLLILEPDSHGGYPAGSQVTLTARASKGYRFTSWEGDTLGSGSSTVLTIDMPMTITANFAEEAPSRWWLWLIVGLAGLLGVVILLWVVRVRVNNRAPEELYWPNDLYWPDE